ncbi:hypothetical protein [Endozoicomonas sp.]|uniref:hypothetical protein n=1 Tax=Endozoicomonas sp. TaxID=1892382 RepID=UPI00383ADFB5
MKKLVSLIPRVLSLLIVGGCSISTSEQSARVASLSSWAMTGSVQAASPTDAQLLIHRPSDMMGRMPASWKR